MSKLKENFSGSVLTATLAISTVFGAAAANAQGNTSIRYHFSPQALNLGGSPTVDIDCTDFKRLPHRPGSLYATCDLVEKMDPNRQEICNDPAGIEHKPIEEQAAAYSRALNYGLHHFALTHNVCSNELLGIYNRAGKRPPANLKTPTSSVPCPIVDINRQCKSVLGLD